MRIYHRPPALAMCDGSMGPALAAELYSRMPLGDTCCQRVAVSSRPQRAAGCAGERLVRSYTCDSCLEHDTALDLY